MRQFDIIDADGHIYEKDAELFEHLEGPYAGKLTLLGYPLWPSMDGFQRGAIYARLNVHKSFVTTAQIWLDFLDQTGIALTVLYPTSGLACGFIRDPEWAVALTRAYNNWLSERYLKVSPRLLGMALLPLQDPAEAVKELRRAVTELHLVGGVLPGVGLRKPLGHSDFDPIYAEAERLGCALAVHAGPLQGLGLELLDKFAQMHTLAHPFGQMIQMTSLVMSGVLDRFPRLHLAFLEAGTGWVPFLMDRMDRSYEGRPRKEYIGDVRHKPSTYLKSGRIFFNVDPAENTLSSVIQAIGAEAFFFTCDFPHEGHLESCRREISALENWQGLSDEERRKILSENTRRFYRLPD
jgi:predicted TIM-barrel fold metal-dependent hydrolase